MQPIKSVLPFCSALPIQYTPVESRWTMLNTDLFYNHLDVGIRLWAANWAGQWALNGRQMLAPRAE